MLCGGTQKVAGQWILQMFSGNHHFTQKVTKNTDWQSSIWDESKVYQLTVPNCWHLPFHSGEGWQRQDAWRWCPRRAKAASGLSRSRCPGTPAGSPKPPPSWTSSCCCRRARARGRRRRWGGSASSPPTPAPPGEDWTSSPASERCPSFQSLHSHQPPAELFWLRDWNKALNSTFALSHHFWLGSKLKC